jgi:two-component sensor histidine kinase
MTATIHQLHQADEAQRLAVLQRYNILDTPRDAAFDRITAIAARMFDVPIAVISLVDEKRIWFKSHHGLEVREIGRDPGLCASAILQQEPWILKDARLDARSKSNPLVTGDFGLRFYVGVPLRTPDGYNLGMLCVLDHEPHDVTEAQVADLQDLAFLVMDQMELRLSARRAVDGLTRLASEKEIALELANLMAKEVDHRVKNSLGLVSRLLTMQSNTLKGSECAEELMTAASRVAAIGRAHQHLHATDCSGLANCTDYIKRLCYDLWTIIGSEYVQEVTVTGSELQVSPRHIVSIGLVVNELVTNAAKHGATRIQVALEKSAAGYALSVLDNGPGLPEGFDPAISDGLGMKIICTQAQTMGARLIFARTEGAYRTRFAVMLPQAVLH